MSGDISEQALDLAIESAQMKAIKRVKHQFKHCVCMTFDEHLLALVMFNSHDVRFRTEISPIVKFNLLIERVKRGDLVGVARGHSAFFRLPIQRLHALSRRV
jgi:hypothetical protein